MISCLGAAVRAPPGLEPRALNCDSETWRWRAAGVRGDRKHRSPERASRQRRAYPKVLMKPFTEPSAYRDTMSPIWRKLDICSDILTAAPRQTCSAFPIGAGQTLAPHGLTARRPAASSRSSSRRDWTTSQSWSRENSAALRERAERRSERSSSCKEALLLWGRRLCSPSSDICLQKTATFSCFYPHQAGNLRSKLSQAAETEHLKAATAKINRGLVKSSKKLNKSRKKC